MSSSHRDALRRWWHRHGAIAIALLTGVVVGFLGAELLHANIALERRTVAAAVGIVAVGITTDMLTSAARRLGSRATHEVRGRRSGRRRLDADLLGKTMVVEPSSGGRFLPPRWVDPVELDHVGFTFGTARTPTYVPLFGNGLHVLDDIEVTRTLNAPGRHDHAADRLLDGKAEELAQDAAGAGRPFLDAPVARLVRWTPPVDRAGPLRIEIEPVGYHRYLASTRLLADDDGPLRDRWGVTARSMDNPIVCGCLGVEVAVITADGQLVIAHRSASGGDYRGQLVTSIGEGLHPDLDVDADDDRVLDPWSAVARGAKEELGLDIDGGATRFLALGLELRRMDPDLLGYVDVPYTATEVRAAFVAGRAIDRWENRTLSFCTFEPRGIATMLASRRLDELTPATPVNLVFALLDRFGEAATMEAFAPRR